MKFKFITVSDPYYREERMLRWEVIEKPKGMPPEGLKSPKEQESIHLIALEKKQLVGCVLCHLQSDSEGMIFDFALSEEYKGKPFSRQMLGTLEEFLVEKGVGLVHVLASEEMKDFYAHLGFSPEGPPFKEFGICYQKMGKTLLLSA